MKQLAMYCMFSLYVSVSLFCFSSPAFAASDDVKVTVKLESVERTPALEQTITVTPAQVWDSPAMAIVWAPAPQGFRFRLYNKQPEPITIVWNECAFIDEKGNRHIITHQGVDRRSNIDINIKGLNPTAIAAGKDWSDVVFPFDSDYMSQEKELQPFKTMEKEETNSAYGMAGIRVKPIFQDKYSEKEIKKILKKINKKEPPLDFPTYIHNQTYGVELSLKFSENQPKYVYRFFFRAQVI